MAVKRFSLLCVLAMAMAGLVMMSFSIRNNQTPTVVFTAAAPKISIAPTVMSNSSSKMEAIRSYMECATSPQGSWVLREDSFVLPAWFTHYPHRYCPNIAQAMTRRESNRTALYYTWRPAQHESICSDLETFSRERFCSVVRGRTIYAIGDSLTYGFFMNLRYLFSKFVGPDISTHEHAILDCALPFPNIKLQFIHTKKLDDIPKRNLTFSDDGILVINTGAHFKETPELLQRIEGFLLPMQQRYPNAQFVWRTTPMGHDIKTYPGKVPFLSALPLDSPPAPINLTSIQLREPKYFTYHYSWHRFLQQNLAVKQILVEKYPQVLFLDVYHMDLLRIDGRIDGLHVCVPGVHMEWSMLLMNLLIQSLG